MLEKEYNEGLVKGLITVPYQEWREQVIVRINFLFGTNYTHMTDDEIMRYLSDEPYEKLIKDME